VVLPYRYQPISNLPLGSRVFKDCSILVAHCRARRDQPVPHRPALRIRQN
jgi:hypothetical protein